MLNLITDLLFFKIDYQLFVDIVSIIVTSLLSIIAIIISVLTLKQNNKIIFENNKPYLSVFTRSISFTSPTICLVLKNFGNSGAKIINIDYDKKLEKLSRRPPFKNMKNVFIAPNQSFVYPLNVKDFLDEVINITVNYQYLNKTYTETFCINFLHYTDIEFQKQHSSKNLEELSNVLQEYVYQQF